MKKKLVVTIVFCFTTCVNAYELGQGWTIKDTAYQGVFLTLLAVDWAQTRTMARNNWRIDGRQYRESCPFMSERPDTKEVDLWFAGAAAGHSLIAAALDPSWKIKVFDKEYTYRRLWQSIWIGVEAGYITNNFSVGVRIEL